MISGDLTTMQLADVLQWADQGVARGTLTVETPAGLSWLNVANRDVVMLCFPPDISAPVRPHGANQAALALAHAAAPDRLLDLFLLRAGTFTFVPGEDRDGGIPLRASIRVLVMEGLRHLDEWPRLSGTYPSENALLTRTDAPESGTLAPIQKAVLLCASSRMSLADARLRLALSRPSLLRRVEELRVMGLISVDGAAAGVDPIARLIHQASALLRAQQFEEAAIVFSSLLAADPSDARVRRLLQDAEREQVAALYQQLDPLAVVHLPDEQAVKARSLTRTDREVVERINGRWDVASLVLGSPLREVETLRSLRRLQKLGVVELRKGG
jgi:DNA-binding Lrp family transcriptional regulator